MAHLIVLESKLYKFIYFHVGGGGTCMKGAGMLRGVNFEFWSHLGCSGQNTIIFSCEGLI